jgi:MFS family permease
MIPDSVVDSFQTTDKNSHILNIAQGIIAAISFSILLAGTNATTPMLPIYQRVLQFSPLMLSMTFVAYVTMLIAVLLFCSRPGFAKWSPTLLSSALLIAAVSDSFLAMASESWIMVGRAIAGVAGGIGTGSAAALVVAALGAKGRSVSATGNLIGAVAGTAFAQYCITRTGDAAMHWTFLIHGGVCLVLAGCLVTVLKLRAKSNRIQLADKPNTDTIVWHVLKLNKIPLLVGSLDWILISTAIVTLPTFFGDLGMKWVSSFGVIMLLIACAASQIGSPWLSRAAPWMSGVLAMSIGSTFILLGATMLNAAVAIAGFVSVGAGIGISYRLSLVVITRGASPAQQGTLSSLYAALTYAAAAAGVLTTGVSGNLLGLHHTVIGVTVLLICSLALVAKKAPRLAHASE